MFRQGLIRARQALPGIALPGLGWALVAGLLLAGCLSVDERRRGTLERAEKFLALGDSVRALQVLDGFLSYDPRDLEINARMAEIHLSLGNPGMAVYLFDSIPKDVDFDERSTALLARALVGAKKIKRATILLSHLEAQDQLDPETLDRLLLQMACCGVPKNMKLPTAWYPQLVEKQLEERRFSLAVGSVREIEQESRRHVLFQKIVHRALDAGEVDLLAKLPEIRQPPASPWKLLARHRVLSKEGLAEEAAMVEQKFLERYPEHPRRYSVLLSMGRREIRSGHAEEGLRLAREAASLRPSNTDPLVEQAFALEALGRADEAERMLEIILASSPNHSGALQLLKRMDRRRELGSKALGGSSNGTTRLRLSIDSRGGA